MYGAWYASLSVSQVGLCNFPACQKPLTRKYFSKRTLEVLKVPSVSISITVLKALKDRALAGHRKFPAAPRNKEGARSARGQEPAGSSGTSGGAVLWEHPLCASYHHCLAAPRAQQRKAEAADAAHVQNALPSTLCASLPLPNPGSSPLTRMSMRLNSLSASSTAATMV